MSFDLLNPSQGAFRGVRGGLAARCSLARFLGCLRVARCETATPLLFHHLQLRALAWSLLAALPRIGLRRVNSYLEKHVQAI